jgi:hypothetical protein
MAEEQETAAVEAAEPAARRRPSLPWGLTPALVVVAVIALASMGFTTLSATKAKRLEAAYAAALAAARDPGNLAYYREANLRLRESPAYAPGKLTVLLGADLAYGWEMLRALPDHSVLNRAIPHQNMVQLLIRMKQDVIDLAPRAVVLLPPICSVLRPEELRAQIETAGRLAEARGIRPVLCMLPPVPAAADTVRGGYAGHICAFNREVAVLAGETGWPLVDLFTPLAGEDRYLAPDYSGARALPNAEGFRLMTVALQRVLDELAAPALETRPEGSHLPAVRQTG